MLDSRNRDNSFSFFYSLSNNSFLYAPKQTFNGHYKLGQALRALPTLRQVKNRMKIKCLKAECPSCKLIGSIQLFFNKDELLRYARTRHFSHIDKDSKKPQFTYCKIQDLDALKTLLLNQGISLCTDKVTAGQVGQGKGFGNLDPQLRGCAFVQQNKLWASSSVRICESLAKWLVLPSKWLVTDRAPAS